MSKTLKVKIRERWYAVEVGDLRGSPFKVLVDGEPVEVDVEQLSLPDAPRRIEGPSTPRLPAPATPQPPPRTPMAPAAPLAGATTPSATKVFRSPMPGVIVSVAVKEGDQVVTGDEVCVLEAMKMQQILRADWSGIVRVVHVQTGQQVLGGDLILELE